MAMNSLAPFRSVPQGGIEFTAVPGTRYHGLHLVRIQHITGTMVLFGRHVPLFPQM